MLKNRHIQQSNTGRTRVNLSLAFEKLISGRSFGVFLRHIEFQSLDFVVHERDARFEFLDRKQAQILPDLMRGFGFRPVLVVESWHC